MLSTLLQLEPTRAAAAGAEQSKLDLIMADVQEMKQDVKEMKQDVKEIKQDVKRVLQLSEDMQKSLAVLTRVVSNLNKRTVPTTFLLMDEDAARRAQKLGDSAASKAMRGGLIYKSLERLDALYSSASAFAKNPAKETMSMILTQLQENMLMYLCCECCMEPQQGGGVWPITIHRPKLQDPEHPLLPLLPLAKAAVTAGRIVNAGLTIGRCFGYPTPSINDQYFTQANEFLDKAGDATFSGEEFQRLQEKVSEYWPTKEDANGSKGSADGSSFSIHEFERFLDSADGDKRWKLILQCVVDGQGNKVYVCEKCENTVV